MTRQFKRSSMCSYRYFFPQIAILLQKTLSEAKVLSLLKPEVRQERNDVCVYF